MVNQDNRSYLQEKVKGILIHICGSSGLYGLQELPQNGETTYYVSGNIDFPGEATKVFKIYINLFFEQNTLHFTTPLYDSGFIGSGNSVFCQLLLELNMSISGNVKIGLFHFNNSNQPCIVYSCALDSVDEASVKRGFDVLKQTFVLLLPLLNMALSQLQLEPHPEARLQSSFANLLESVQLALNTSSY